MFILRKIMSRFVSSVSMRSVFRDSLSRMWMRRDG
jgi:hypothetical protein